jgi:hypothetical protein
MEQTILTFMCCLTHVTVHVFDELINFTYNYICDKTYRPNVNFW